jgi:L-cystine transport system substrate-binding protein
MKKRTLYGALFFPAVMAVFAILAGCAGKRQGTEEAGDMVIYAATESTYPPYSYMGEDNVLTGYDVETVRAISDRLEGYTIDIKALSPDAALLALESRTIEIFFDELAVTPARLERFHFSEPYFEARAVIVTQKGRGDIRSLKDLEGKVVGVYVSDSYSQYLEDYNDGQAAVPIKLEYIDSGTEETTLLNLQNGKYDAHISDPVTISTIIDRNKLNLEIVGDPISGEQIALVFTKDARGAELKGLIDPVIRELKNDGTLSRLSIRFTGGDYIPR